MPAFSKPASPCETYRSACYFTHLLIELIAKNPGPCARWCADLRRAWAH
jgi:hypothetical protein